MVFPVLAIALAIQISTSASEDIGTPVFQSAVSYELGSLPQKSSWALPGELKGSIEVAGFDINASKLLVRDKIDKKLRGKPPEGYESSQFGVTHAIGARDSCIFWLKPGQSFIVVSWSWDESKSPAVITLTIDHWKAR